MSFISWKRRKIFVIVIFVSFLLALSSIIVYSQESRIVDRIITTDGSFSYSSNPNRPFLYYEVRVETGGIINFNEILLNDTLSLPSDWGVEVAVYDEDSSEIDGFSYSDVLVFKCPTRNMTLTAYQISYLLVYYTIEVEAVYYDTIPVILYLLLSIAFIWINYLTYILIKRRKETEKWFKPFRK